MTRRSDARLEIVADHLPRDAAEARERADMTADPVRRGAERRRENPRPPYLAGRHVGDLDRLSGIVREQPFASQVGQRLVGAKRPPRRAYRSQNLEYP